MNKRAIGRLSELKVIEHLKEENIITIKHNYYCKYGEIDIIAKKNDTYRFIEVKYSKSEFINPLYKLNKTKIKRIYQSSMDYLSKINYKNENLEYYIYIVNEKKITSYRFSIDESNYI